MNSATVQRLMGGVLLTAGLAGAALAADGIPQVSPKKGCCCKCQPEQAPAPKPLVEPQKGPPAGKGKGKDETFARDRDTFHFLLENHKDIKRTVKKLDNGVETVTESDKPVVAKKIQEHVPAMYERLKTNRPVRMWDPLFVEAFKHGTKMKLEIKNTAKGVKVTETSDDPAVVRVIQAHADVVSKFVEKGFAEAHEEHPVPAPEKKK